MLDAVPLEIPSEQSIPNVVTLLCNHNNYKFKLHNMQTYSRIQRGVAKNTIPVYC